MSGAPDRIYLSDAPRPVLDASICVLPRLEPTASQSQVQISFEAYPENKKHLIGAFGFHGVPDRI